MTKFKDFFKELLKEAEEEGFNAIEQLKNLQSYYQEKLGKIKSDCLVAAYFAEENKKPPHLRKNYCYISCPCSKCSPGRM